MLANAALPFFSGDSYTCSYAVGCVEIHLGEIDLTIGQTSLEYLDHFRIMCNTPVIRKLMSLACLGCGVSCTLTCDLLVWPGVRLQGRLVERTPGSYTLLNAWHAFEPLIAEVHH